MAPKLVFAQLPTVGGEIRDEYIERLTAASKYALANEPGVLMYTVLLPRDKTNDKSVYAVELYADQAAFDSHMATEGVQEMIKWMSTKKVFDGTPTVHQVELIDEFGILARKQVLEHEDPYIVVGEVSYKEGKVPESLPYWKEVVTTSKGEGGTLVYGIFHDPADVNMVYSMEAYTSESYLWDVHCKSQAAAENMKTLHLRTGVKLNKLKLKAGYLCR